MVDCFLTRIRRPETFVRTSILIGLSGLLAACNSTCTPSEQSATPHPKDVVQKSEDFYKTRPYFQQPIAFHQETPEGLPNLRAETCGACHREIYEEWKISTHARAWLDDAQFQEELKKSRGAGGNGDVGWMCINCHTPVMNQLPQLVVGLQDGKLNAPIYEPNPFYDPVMELDAITCATCHVKDGKILGPYGDSTHAPHPVQKSDTLLSEETCTRCHQAEAVFPDINLGCFFTTGAEWKASPAAARGETCQHCHMPEVERAIAIQPNLPIRKTRRHWFGGSLIPKHPSYEAEIAPLRAIYGDGVETRLHAVSKPCTTDEQCQWVSLDVANTRAGHHVPTGDPERHMIFTLTAKAGGEVIAEKTVEFGSKYQWWPTIEKLSDTRIAAGETRVTLFELPKNVTELSLKAEKFRMYEDAFNHHHLEGRYVRGRVFHESRWTFENGVLTEESD